MCSSVLRMLTFLPLEQIDEMDTWKDAQLNVAKEILAFELTKLVHGEEEAVKAQTAAKALFAGGGDDANMPTTEIPADKLADGKIGILNLMVCSSWRAPTARQDGWCSRAVCSSTTRRSCPGLCRYRGNAERERQDPQGQEGVPQGGAGLTGCPGIPKKRGESPDDLYHKNHF